MQGVLGLINGKAARAQEDFARALQVAPALASDAALALARLPLPG